MQGSTGQPDAAEVCLHISWYTTVVLLLTIVCVIDVAKAEVISRPSTVRIDEPARIITARPINHSTRVKVRDHISLCAHTHARTPGSQPGEIIYRHVMRAMQAGQMRIISWGCSYSKSAQYCRSHISVLCCALPASPVAGQVATRAVLIV